MATLNLTDKEFADIAMIWLFDQVMNPEQNDNKRFGEFLEKHSSKIRTPLTKYYLDSDSETRLKYKRIKGVFDGTDNSIQQIRIGPSKKEIEDEKKKDGIVKRILKKVFTKEELDLEEKNMLKEINMIISNNERREI